MLEVLGWVGKVAPTLEALAQALLMVAVMEPGPYFGVSVEKSVDAAVTMVVVVLVMVVVVAAMAVAAVAAVAAP